MESYEFIASLAVTLVAIAGLLWRFETRLSDLSDRVSRIEGRMDGFADIFATKADIARIEGLLEGYFMQSGKTQERKPTGDT